jgi:hypothetical protein
MRKHRKNRGSTIKKKWFESRVSVEDQNKKKKSLGALRKHQKTKPNSPDATGKLYFQRHTLAEICRQLDEVGGDDEIACNIAAWRNNDQRGPYLTVEVSPQFVTMSSDCRIVSHSMTCSMRKMSNN